MRRSGVGASRWYRRPIRWAAAALLVALAARGLSRWDREGVTDPGFDTRVAQPAFGATRPRVLFDAGHRNLHTIDGRYKGFTDLIAHDGYDVRASRDSLSANGLRGVDVVVLVGARGPDAAESGDALTRSEVVAVVAWVRAGGSLLLITDHYPFGAAVRGVAHEFGVEISNGIVEDPLHYDSTLGPSHILFTRANGLLREHAITEGRTQAERVQRVLTFTGTSLAGPAGAAAFLELSESAVDRPASLPTVEREGKDVRVTVLYGDPTPAEGRAQGLAMTFGAGRVVVLGETGMLSAQRNGPHGSRVGMNVPGYDNRQLALNIMHWLSRLL